MSMRCYVIRPSLLRGTWSSAAAGVFASMTLAFSAAVSAQPVKPATAPMSAAHATAPANVQARQDSMRVTIAPTKRVEVKLIMTKGQKADFVWSTNGPEVTYNLHAEVPTDSSVKAHVYKRGLSAGEKGSIVAVFDGVHGWAWRNLTDKPVTVSVKASGQFSALKKM